MLSRKTTRQDKTGNAICDFTIPSLITYIPVDNWALKNAQSRHINRTLLCFNHIVDKHYQQMYPEIRDGNAHKPHTFQKQNTMAEIETGRF
jgi:hypothetical protein